MLAPTVCHVASWRGSLATGLDPVSPEAGSQPVRHPGPTVNGGRPTGDQGDVTPRQLDVALVRAPHMVHQGADTARRRDVILLGADDQERASHLLEVHRIAAQAERAL